jgi:hypothetical protein
MDLTKQAAYSEKTPCDLRQETEGICALFLSECKKRATESGIAI